MEIKTDSMKRCELVTLSGEIDSATAPELEQSLLSLVDSGKKNLVLNLRDVTFISSPGLKALLAAQVKARRKVPAGEVVIAETSPKMREVLELVGLHHLFKLYDTEVEAVGSF
jgi:anti-sigma B factor antagonist